MNRPNSYIEFTKKLIDEINAFHAGGALPPTYNTANIGGLHFYDSVVIAEKRQLPFQPVNLRIGDKPTNDSAYSL